MGAPLLVVLGAGVQGLTFALEALGRGRRVIVADKAPAVGGQTRVFRYGRFLFDHGMHAFVSSDPALSRLMRHVLREDYSSFRARAASWLGPGRVLADDASWRCGESLFRQRAASNWNCMRVVRPPVVVYPRRGGFAAICARLAERVRERGGRVLLGTPLSPADFEVRGGALRAVRLRGRRVETAGCFWSADPRPPEAGDALLLYHFLVEGRAPLPYHWVRLAVENPLLPSIVYYPGNFSAANAPKGHYGVGAAVPLLAARRGPPSAIADWYGRSPADFLPWMTRFLSRAGFLDEARVIGARLERVPLPLDRPPRRGARLPVKARNIWAGERWRTEAPGESLVPAQMRSALAAARALCA